MNKVLITNAVPAARANPIPDRQCLRGAAPCPEASGKGSIA